MHNISGRKTGPISAPASAKSTATSPAQAKRGRKPLEIVESPVALFLEWTEPDTFHEAFLLHIRRHGENIHRLARALDQAAAQVDAATLRSWAIGKRMPRSVRSLALLARIEHRYRLPEGYFKERLLNPSRAAAGHTLPGISRAEKRRLAWHLPDDFDRRPAGERDAIIEWVRRVIISGTTDYRRFQADARRHRYGIRFGNLPNGASASPADDPEAGTEVESDPDLAAGGVDAPLRLASEMASLLAFKTATLTAIGYQRNGVWGEETSAQKLEHLGLMFGALAAPPTGEVAGFGVPLGSLTFAILVFPQVWDWYVQWRERRRGFYTRWEMDMLCLGMALTRDPTGWLRQNPQLANRLRPISPLVTEEEVKAVQNDWQAACDRLHVHVAVRSKEIARVARVHRDPFEPILAVLEAESPVGEYRKITEEIVRLMPNSRRYPREAAEAVRSLLMLRLGLHSGLRQRNLRELLLCQKRDTPRTERQLEAIRRGELRWNLRESVWEIFIPSAAFKNGTSSFFSGKPFRLVLADLGGLYAYLDSYLATHRAVLLAGANDPGTVFVKTVKAISRDASYDQTTFYEAWRLTIQRYGIFNPFTGRGAVAGLLPHGPHSVRDVLATHVLKQTGSYEQASYAIQDTPAVVAKHYGRFLPKDKAAMAAEILNRAWEAT